MTFEEDGNASLHCHILVWFFVRGSFADNFNKFVQCHQHRKESGFRNPAWRFGFYDSKNFEFEPIPDISRPSKVSKNISDIKQENNLVESSETKINISRFQIKPKSAIALEMEKTYLEKK